MRLFYAVLASASAVADYSGYKRVSIRGTDKVTLDQFESVNVWSDTVDTVTFSISSSEYEKLIQKVPSAQVLIDNIQE